MVTSYSFHFVVLGFDVLTEATVSKSDLVNAGVAARAVTLYKTSSHSPFMIMAHVWFVIDIATTTNKKFVRTFETSISSSSPSRHSFFPSRGLVYLNPSLEYKYSGVIKRLDDPSFSGNFENLFLYFRTYVSMIIQYTSAIWLALVIN